MSRGSTPHACHSGTFRRSASWSRSRPAQGLGYHPYPMVALALLAAGLAISAIDREPARSSWPRVFSAIVTAAIFANACVWFNGSIDVRPIEEQVARLGPRPKLLVLSAAVVIGYPMVRGAARHLGLAPGSLLGPGGGAPCRARRNDRRPGGSPPVRPCCTGARWADRRFPAAAARRGRPCDL